MSIQSVALVGTIINIVAMKTLAFSILKFDGLITCSWWWALAPAGIAIGLVTAVVLLSRALEAN